MTASIIIRLAFSTGASMLKAAHSEPFSSGSMKTRIFVLQLINKIVDAAEATEDRKIRYKMSLLRGSAAE